MKVKTYHYNGKDFFSEEDVRIAIFEQDRIAFGKVNSAEEWLSFGVQLEEVDVTPPLDELKSRKLNRIKESFLKWRQEDAVLTSSLGFDIDSTERANSDVSGLLVAYEEKQGEQIVFRGSDNVFHALTYDQLKTLQKEIVENGCFAYEQKWRMDALVDSAESKEDLEKISTTFCGKSFTKEE